MHVKVDAGPYSEQLGVFFNRAFPGIGTNQPEALFEAVMLELIGSKQTRYGPKPKPESMVMIRAIVRTAMDAGLPIPVLAPWGSRKLGLYTIDVAEVFALKTLRCLNSRVSALYAPGIHVRIRLEDLTDSWLFHGQPSVWIEEYARSFQRLVSAVAPELIDVVSESTLMDATEHWAQATSMQPIFAAYLRSPEGEAPESAVSALKAIGWLGSIPDVQRAYYYKAYERFYPGMDPVLKLAEYFASTMARVSLCKGGATDTHAQAIQLSFSLPVPGSPMNNPRIYMRTLPLRYCSSHKAPWNAKGYFKLDADEVAIPKLAGWNDAIPYEAGHAVISSDTCECTVQSDYISS